MATDELEHRRVGRPSKGPRKQIAVRPDPDLKAFYEDRAREMGIPAGAWIILTVNTALGLPIPDAVQRDIDAARARQRVQDEELPLLSA